MFNPLQMPCDWDLARKHALAHRTATAMLDDETEGVQPETCPCCGFEINRKEIGFCESSNQLKFLGSGFPLFYNYLRFCILILFVQSIVASFNLYTNFVGNYCTTQIIIYDKPEPVCQDSIYLKISLANKINNQYMMELFQRINIITTIVTIGLLAYFRRSQMKLDAQIDELQLTPSDYTLKVTNIPKNMSVNYRWELVNIFQNYAVLDSRITITVTKVVLVYDIQEILSVEAEIEKLIVSKKQILFQNQCDYSALEVLEVDQEIKKLKSAKELLEEKYFMTNYKFTGTAFVSFKSEDMKEAVLTHNVHTKSERIRNFFSKGKTPNLEDSDLQWQGQKLFVEQAPEPNDVDWNYIHIPTADKFISRIKAFIFSVLFQTATFILIYVLSIHMIKAKEESQQLKLHGLVDEEKERTITILCWGLTLIIVVFNNFVVGFALDKFVSMEKISTKTAYQISFAKKYTLCLFMNAALISFILDVMIFKNVFGYAGFIYNESLIFILNAFLSPLIWLLDPWTLIKNYQREKEMINGDKSLLTQQEANQLMEQVSYLSAKRYSDIIKTMWFAYFFGLAIPLGVIASLLGLILYYYVDKYNILRRRTVKESISKELSIQMLYFLEAIVIFGPIGSIVTSDAFYHKQEIMDLISFLIGSVYFFMPFDYIIDYLFPIKSNEDPVDYELGQLDFDTDYDRENPVTKGFAINEFQKLVEHRQETKNKITHPESD